MKLLLLVVFVTASMMCSAQSRVVDDTSHDALTDYCVENAIRELTTLQVMSELVDSWDAYSKECETDSSCTDSLCVLDHFLYPTEGCIAWVESRRDSGVAIPTASCDSTCSWESVLNDSSVVLQNDAYTWVSPAPKVARLHHAYNEPSLQGFMSYLKRECRTATLLSY